LVVVVVVVIAIVTATVIVIVIVVVITCILNSWKIPKMCQKLVRDRIKWNDHQSWQ